MKKYLITESQRLHIAAVFDSIGNSEPWLKTLKPIDGHVSRMKIAVWQSWHDSYGNGYWDTRDEAELNSAIDFEPVPLYEESKS